MSDRLRRPMSYGHRPFWQSSSSLTGSSVLLARRPGTHSVRVRVSQTLTQEVRGTTIISSDTALYDRACHRDRQSVTVSVHFRHIHGYDDTLQSINNARHVVVESSVSSNPCQCAGPGCQAGRMRCRPAAGTL